MDSPKTVTGGKGVLGQVFSYFTNSRNTPDKEDLITENRGSSVCNPNNSESLYVNKKGQTLHSAHKMNEQQKGWFENIEALPGSNQEHFPLPPYLKQKQCKTPSSDTHTSQIAFNINRNCYENLSVHQTHYNPYSPCLHQFNQQEIFLSEEEDTLSLAPPFQPLGYLYENIMDFMETTIVQYVCQRTHPSPFRQAAETLARSKLNPNAKEFTPKVETRTLIESHEESDANNYLDTIEQSFGLDHDESITGEVEIEDEEDIKSSRKGETIKEDRQCSTMVQYDASDNSFCDKIKACENDFGDYDFYDEDEDESDWDSDEQSTGQCVEIDPSEFEDLFTSPLLMSNLGVCVPIPNSSHCFSVCPARPVPPTQTVKTISHFNFEISDLDSSPSSKCEKSAGKCVTFSDDVNVIEEPEDLANDLQNARISDFPARQADRERRERLLAPILTEKHRSIMYQKIYGEC